MAISAQKDGLLPLAQTSLRFYNCLGYHEYEGVADHSERERLIEHMGTHKAMILRNHGLLTAGENIPEAFSLLAWKNPAVADRRLVRRQGTATADPGSLRGNRATVVRPFLTDGRPRLAGPAAQA